MAFPNSGSLFDILLSWWSITHHWDLRSEITSSGTSTLMTPLCQVWVSLPSLRPTGLLPPLPPCFWLQLNDLLPCLASPLGQGPLCPVHHYIFSIPHLGLWVWASVWHSRVWIQAAPLLSCENVGEFMLPCLSFVTSKMERMRVPLSLSHWEEQGVTLHRKRSVWCWAFHQCKQWLFLLTFNMVFILSVSSVINSQQMTTLIISLEQNLKHSRLIGWLRLSFWE